MDETEFRKKAGLIKDKDIAEMMLFLLKKITKLTFNTECSVEDLNKRRV